MKGIAAALRVRAGGGPTLHRDSERQNPMVPVAVGGTTAGTIHDAILFGDKQHGKLVIMGPHEVGKAGEELKARKIPVILGRELALPDHKDDSYDPAMSLANQLHNACVKFAFGTFTSEFVRNLGFDAANAVAFGQPPDEALKSVTINLAQIWGEGDQLGSIEAAKCADLLLTNGDPLDVRTKIEHVCVKGREVESHEQTRLYDKYMGRQ